MKKTLSICALFLVGCSAPVEVLDKAGCAIEAKAAKVAGADFRQQMKTCRDDSDCLIYPGVCQPDAVHRKYETCAIWQANEMRKMTKCAAYFGDISKVTASCDSGICTAHDPWKPPWGE